MTVPSFKSVHGREFGYGSDSVRVRGQWIGPGAFPPLNAGATRWYVDSNVDGEGGRNPDEALGTLDEAINKASEYDQIIVMAGHDESLAAASGVDVDVAGLTIIGQGSGSNQPIFRHTAAAATFDVGAADVVLCNLHFIADVTTVAVGIDVQDGSDDLKVLGCRFTANTLTTDEYTDALSITTSDRVEVAGCYFDMDQAAAASAIHFVGICLGANVHDNFVVGDYSAACIEGITAAAEQLWIHHNTLVNGVHGGLNTVACISLFTGTTGFIEDNRLYTNVATPDLSIVADGCFLANNRYSETAAGADELLYTPRLPDDTYNFLGVDDADNAAATTNVVANRDGSVLERQEFIQTAVNNGTGTALASNESLADILYAANGISTWPDPAAPADAVSLAEGLRWLTSRMGVREGINPFSSVLYVAASGGSDAATGGGLDPTEPLATIAQAITNSAAGDTIVLGPGTHSVDVSAAALAPKANTKFVGAIPPHGGKPSTIITHDADDGVDLITIDVDGVVFEGIEFLLVAGGTTALRTVSVSQTTAVNGLSFKDCWFNLNSVDAAGVISLAVNDATNDTIGLSVTNCRFLGGDATTNQAIYVDIGVGGATRALFEKNMFECESADADCLALNFADPGASGGSYAFTFRNNDIIGPKDGGGDGTPIVFAGAMTEDEIVPIIRTNFFSGTAATPITQDKINTGIVWNYVGDDATGGTLVDPGT